MTVGTAYKTDQNEIASAFSDLEPKPLWKHFDALTRIPRPSKKEDRVREYVKGQAGRLGLEAIEDHAGNLICSSSSNDDAGTMPNLSPTMAMPH
jgi:di/tripeptidase